MDAISNVELDRNIAEHIHSISPLICTYDFDPRSNLSAPELSFISAEPVRTWTAEKQIEICSVLAFILNLLAYLTCNEKRLNNLSLTQGFMMTMPKGGLMRVWTRRFSAGDELENYNLILYPPPNLPSLDAQLNTTIVPSPFPTPGPPLHSPAPPSLANFHNHHRYLPPFHRRRHHHPVTTTSQNNQPHRLFLTTSHYSCWIFRTCTSRLH